MEQKEPFSRFIAEKRKAANLTQHELAEQLQLSDTAVSEWECGISYPDITMIAPVCRLLNITEHEFLSACDDSVFRLEKKQAKHYRTLGRVSRITLLCLYGAAILACFIVNLAVSGTLSWFWIVLVSVLLAFSLTSLPQMVRWYRPLHAMLFTTAGVYLLLPVCRWYTGAFLLDVSYKIATTALVAAWAIFAVVRYVRANGLLKSAMICLLCGVFIMLMNPLIQYYITGAPVEPVRILNPALWYHGMMGNMIAGYVLIFYGIFAGIAGLVRQFTTK